MDPRHSRHVAEQQHPLKERLLGLMTAYYRAKLLITTNPHRTSILRPRRHAWIGEDPCGNVCSTAHDVLHVQTSLNAGLPAPLSAHDPLYGGHVHESSTKQTHELSQVRGVVVLLQELTSIQLADTFSTKQYFQEFCLFCSYLCHSLTVVRSSAHIFRCKVVTAPDD